MVKALRSHSSGSTGLLRQLPAPWWTRYFPKENTSFNSFLCFYCKLLVYYSSKRKNRGQEKKHRNRYRFDLKEAQQIATDSCLFRAVSDKPPFKRQRLGPGDERWWPMARGPGS